MGKVKIRRKTPTGKVKIVERRKKPRIAKCAICRSPLHGVPRKIPAEMRKLALSERRPNRPYGGHLCSKCAREILKGKVRELIA